MSVFRDRREAGRRLAEKLQPHAYRPDVTVLALPRGGVPVAYEVALALHAPLDICTVRKLGVPGHEELAMGAIATGGARVINQDVVRTFNIPAGVVEAVAKKELQELERRERAYRGPGRRLPLRSRTAILVDDGLATGASMHVAIMSVRIQAPAQVVLAVPTAPLETCSALAQAADEVICAATPEPFYGVSRWYTDFPQVSDEEVQQLLEEAAHSALPQ